MYRLEHPLLSLLLLAGGLILLAGASTSLEAQLREVVSSRIAVSQDEASLHLELVSDDAVDISLREGDVVVDGETIGGYVRGDALDASWRALLGDAVALDNGPLARALVDWSPPGEAAGDGGPGAVARRLDQLLEERLAAPAPAEAPSDPTAAASAGPADDFLELLRREDRLGVLGSLLRGLNLDGDVRVAVDEDVVVGEGEEILGSLVVVDGNVDVRGTVRGDIAVTGGRIRLEEGGTITGDVRMADAGLSRDGGTVEGTVTEISDVRIRLLEALAELDDLDDLEELENLSGLEDLMDVDEIEEDIRERVRAEIEAEMGSDSHRFDGPGFFGPLRSVGRGLGGLVQNVIGFLVALVIALGVIRLFPGNLTLVQKAAERSPGRAAVVGLAGAFLLVPVYVLGMVVLAVSIVGIPVLLLWIPLFPLAAVLAAGLGYLAVAVLLGRWIVRQGFRGLDFLEKGNDLHAAAAGLAVLLVPYAIANVLLMGGSWLGAIHSLFHVVGILAGAVALIVGFGGVLLTRGGRRPVFAGGLPGMDEPVSSTWGAEAGPTGAGSRWEEWEDEWSREWDEEWEDLEREARDRGEGEEGTAGPAEAEEGEGGAGVAEEEKGAAESEPASDDDERGPHA